MFPVQFSSRGGVSVICQLSKDNTNPNMVPDLCGCNCDRIPASVYVSRVQDATAKNDDLLIKCRLMAVLENLTDADFQKFLDDIDSARRFIGYDMVPSDVDYRRRFLNRIRDDCDCGI